MPVNHEVKSTLAKLLATEDLVVEHKKVETACFNVHTRVLTLPMWEKASETVYDMLVSHEVGHALYTPDEDWAKQYKVPPQFVNVVEDARIEKLMKRRYNGLNRVFYNAYKELNEQDFFAISDDDLSTYNLADRVNLWFKIGNYTNVPIERDEVEIVNMIADAETFEDALNAAVALYDRCKQQQQQDEEVSANMDVENTTQGGGDTTQDMSNFSEEGENNSEEFQSVEPKQDDSYGGTAEKKDELPAASNEGGDSADPEVKTMDALNESIQQLVNSGGFENTYLELPKLNLDTVIAKNNDIYKYLHEYWNSHSETIENLKLHVHYDSNYIKFKKNSEKEVNYLVKEFECRKAADSYARATTARTGVLDCSKLHTYKFNEDLFKKITTLADGKNHGLVFVLDWSGSMQNVLIDTLKQLYNIIWFCRKVNIPFDVYAFSNEWNELYYNQNNIPVYPKDHYTKKENLVAVDKSFSMMNLFTSKVVGKKLDEQMRDVFRLAHSFNSHYISYPSRLTLSGTPLNESLISLHQIIPQFKKEHKLQKVHCIVLTDGEASALTHHVEIRRNWEAPYMGIRRIDNNCFIRNRKTGKTYKANTQGFVGFTNTLLYDLRDTFADVNFVGIRVILPRDASQFIRNNTSYDNQEKLISEWKKERSIALTETGYHRYFGMSSTALSTEVEFQVQEDASKSAIRNAFKKSLNSKKMNKKFLNEFIKLVA
jgi:hypothetical protein